MTTEEYFKTPETNKHIELRDGVLIEFATPTTQHQDIVGGLYSEIRSFIRTNGRECKPFIFPPRRQAGRLQRCSARCIRYLRPVKV